jgi:hypothetical protein
LILLKGLIAYFIEIDRKYVFLVILIIILLSHFVYFTIGSNLAISITSAISQIIWVTGILIPFIKWKKFIQLVDKHLWYQYFIIAMVGLDYLPIGILIFIDGQDFGLYDADNLVLIFLNYGYLLIITILLQILIVHLEYKISQIEKYNLKDIYSHNLGNALQAVYTSSELLTNPNLNKEKENELKRTLQNKFQEADELLRDIRNL